MSKKRLGWMLIALMAIVPLAGCGDDDDAPPPPASSPPTLGVLISSPSVSPVTSFGQARTSNDPDTNGNGWSAPFPDDYVNVWDITPDFALSDGSDDQFDGALELTVGTSDFPYDQVYSELTFYTPTMGAGQGVITAAASDGGMTGYSAITGTYSAFLNSTSESRLRRTLDLTAATAPVSLDWDHDVAFYDGDISGYASGFRVVVRNIAGAELEELFATTIDDLGSYNADLSAYAGQSIVLSFEYSTVSRPWGPALAVIDNVSVLDSAGSPVQYATNGDFESGNLTGWTTNTAAEVQNMTSGVRTLEGLDVKRSFYTVPNKLWGRWVDVFSNPTGSTITKTVTYRTNLGSDSAGIIYPTPGTSNKSLTTWDGSGYDRDVAWVHGLASSVTYTSATALATYDGNDNIYVTYDITVPASGSVALVNFIVMGTYDTGLTAADTTARATEVDAAAAAIVSKFRTDGQYRTGMTQAQINAIMNF